MRIGQLVAGRYELDDMAGVGGMSCVFRAHDTVLERPVALKILHEHYADDPVHVARFRREAQAIARLAHPNVVTVIDRGEWNGSQYIVFEHVAGENLKEIVRREGPLPVERTLDLGCQIARGLAFAHEHGIVHRDVKPHNVLVDEAGTAKVTDFGIARSLHPDEGLTETGAVVGTAHYIAPEQATGRGADERSDQYSLGVVLYELLTGEVPFPGESFVAAAARHATDPLPGVRAARPDVPPRLAAAVARATEKRPEERFPSMSAFRDELEACLEAAADPHEGVETLVLPPRQRRSRAWMAAATAAALAVAAAAAAAVVSRGGGERVQAVLGGAGEPAAARPAVPVRLRAVADHDPRGDGEEHPEDVAAATDGDPQTYWTTEGYEDFAKEGVGIVLDAGVPREPESVTVLSDLPGYTAEIRAGEHPEGPFRRVSRSRTVEAKTAFRIDAGGERYRYWLVWITDPNGRAHVNEVRARAAG